jgi:uncharacterized membrane protein YkvA (DUF1232 family)
MRPTADEITTATMAVLQALKTRARQLKSEVYALYLAGLHPQTPRYAKLYLLAIVAYALSPIDLIPDFIPVLGLLDELILLPFAIALAVKLIPQNVMAECRARAAEEQPSGSRLARYGAAFIGLLWLAFIAAAALWAYSAFAHERTRGVPEQSLLDSNHDEHAGKSR